MRMCSFPGCERPDGHGGYHGYWNPEATGWVPLAEQRTRAEQMRDRREKINGRRAEKIAADALRAWWDNPTTDHPQIVDMIAAETHGPRGALFALVESAALAALTEMENAR